MTGRSKDRRTEAPMVIWKPEQCIHSEKGFKMLTQFFNLNCRPQVNMNGVFDKEIRSQIDFCLSAAPSYHLNEETKEIEVKKEQLVEMALNGPLMVYGNSNLTNSDDGITSKRCISNFCR